MDIELGKPVLGNDGEEIGDVERLIVDPNERVVREFMIKEGTLLSTDRIVHIDLVTRIDSDGTVHLSIASDDADSLPAFVEDRYVAPTEHELNEMPQAWIGAAGGAGGGPLLWGAAGPPRGEPGQGSMFEPASVPTAPAEPDYPIDQTNVVIDEGTDVVDKDGEAVGTVDEVHYDAQGRISGLKVTSGTIFTKKLNVPLKWVDSMQPDAVRLSITGEEAESAGEIRDES
jgi:uncharacterized protein YrrD